MSFAEAQRCVPLLNAHGWVVKDVLVHPGAEKGANGDYRIVARAPLAHAADELRTFLTSEQVREALGAAEGSEC